MMTEDKYRELMINYIELISVRLNDLNDSLESIAKSLENK